MEKIESPQKAPSGNIPRIKDNAFNIRDLSMREFEAFMILLIHEGVEQSILKRLIDIEFDHKSQTRGYDYINNLCKKGFAYKKKAKVKGKLVVRIYVRASMRKKYDKFILPTVSNLSESLNDIIKEYVDGIKEETKIREKFKGYTETIILALSDLITDTPVKTLSANRFQKKMYDTIWNYFRAEILKYEVFSKWSDNVFYLFIIGNDFKFKNTFFIILGKFTLKYRYSKYYSKTTCSFKAFLLKELS